MLGHVETVLNTLLKESFPSLFGGQSPAVQLRLSRALFAVDPSSADALASAPRPDDRIDRIAFDPANPAGPYQLSQPPYPGPRRLWLATTAGDRIALQPEEVLWDSLDSRQFTLALRPNRDPSGFSMLEVLYGVTAIFTKLRLTHTLTLALSGSNPTQLNQAESLLLGWLALNRQALIDAANATHTAGDYESAIAIKTLTLSQGEQTPTGDRTLTLLAESELKATRALQEDEGQPIERILTNGHPLNPDRPIDIHIDLNI
jgi:hypothetical protein